MPDDLFVFEKIREGDIEAFELLFRRYCLPLCLYASGITGRVEVAEEVVQEVFYRIWKNREHIRTLRSVRRYLYGAVRNLSLRYIEQRSMGERYMDSLRRDDRLSTDPSPLEYLEYKELERIIRLTLLQLPERRMRIFRMHRMEGKKYKEIAASLSISVKTVEAEMTKAYKTLRRKIQNYMNRL
jgi:RNA polymerase sigma-70 factor (ECF subfamily)